MRAVVEVIPSCGGGEVVEAATCRFADPATGVCGRGSEARRDYCGESYRAESQVSLYVHKSLFRRMGRSPAHSLQLMFTNSNWVKYHGSQRMQMCAVLHEAQVKAINMNDNH